MEWFTVISLIFVGIVLVVVEIIFIPGTTIVGFIGFGITIAGIVLSFNYFGRPVGWITLASTGVVTCVVMVWAMRSKAWERFSLKSTIQSKVNEGALEGLKEGEEGVAVSALRPSGKAEIAGKLYEVNTLGGFVDSGAKVRIVQISSNHIVVEPIN